MRILGIESSCDETAVAIVQGDGDVVGVEQNLVSSQVEIHKLYGGVVPEVAARRHVDVIFPLLLEAGVPRAGSGIDAIAVTAGPGLVPALRVGVELGKTLAWAWGKPLVAVNHLEGHIYSVWLPSPNNHHPTPAFPSLCLLVSGGHTELILMRSHGQYELVGKTRDDAAGECFDKVAKLLGLPYPGGPQISKLATQGNRAALAFPRPMLESGDFDFSFSGLKTAVAVELKKQEGSEQKSALEDICASFEEAVVESLVTKTVAAVEKFRPASVILAGGVAANRHLRETLAAALSQLPITQNAPPTLHVPDLRYTGDNAAMIAAVGYFKALRREFSDPLTLEANPNMRLAL